MATLNQIEANRLNAQKSTGPRSPEGKAASRMNALKSGLDAKTVVVRDEDPRALEALTAEYMNRFQPTTPEQRALVDSLIFNDWLLRRIRRSEAELWNYHWDIYEKAGNLNVDLPLADIYTHTFQRFAYIQRRLDATERNYLRALKELERLRPQPGPGPQPVAATTSCPEIGFVPPKPAAQASGPLPNGRGSVPDVECTEPRASASGPVTTSSTRADATPVPAAPTPHPPLDNHIPRL